MKRERYRAAVSLALALSLLACASSSEGTAQHRCSCEPSERESSPLAITHAEKHVAAGAHLLQMLRRHEAAGTSSEPAPRSLWPIIASYCSPCSWASQSSKLDEMYPIEHLGQAIGVGCLFLTMPDGTRRYGALRPAECRPREAKPQ